MTYSLEELKAMVPIYLNGRLSESEARAFESELKRHPELENELKAFTDIQESYAAIEDYPALNSDALFNRIQNGIRKESQQAGEHRREGVIALLSRLFKNVYHRPALSWSIAGLQFAALLVLFFVIPRQTLFNTYSSTSPPAKGRVRINVVFAQEAREVEIRALLQELGASIIDGPSPEGLYVLEIQKTGDMNEVLEKLKQSPIVRLAEKSLSQLDRRRSFAQTFREHPKQTRIWPVCSGADPGPMFCRALIVPMNRNI